MKHWKELLAMAALLLFIIGGLYWVENHGPKHPVSRPNTRTSLNHGCAADGVTDDTACMQDMASGIVGHINVVSIEENGKERTAITCDVYQFQPEKVDNCKLSGSLDAAMQAVVDDLIAARKR